MATSKKTNATNKATTKKVDASKGLFADMNHKKKWDIDTEGFEYIKLKDYIEANGDAPIVVNGFYISETELGEALTIIADTCFINMPSHAIENFKALDNDKMVAHINARRLAIGNFEKKYIKKFKNETIYFDLLDTNEI